jgi:hypothetical protein
LKKLNIVCRDGCRDDLPAAAMDGAWPRTRRGGSAIAAMRLIRASFYQARRKRRMYCSLLRLIGRFQVASRPFPAKSGPNRGGIQAE